MKQGNKYGNYEYNLKYLTNRYKIARQSLQEYIEARMEILNASGIQVKKMGKEWRFTAQAVKMLDEMRNYDDDSVVVADYESPETTRIKELEEELKQVKQENLDLKTEKQGLILVNGSQAQTIEAERKAKQQLQEDKDKLLLLTSQAEAEKQQKDDRIAELQADGERKDQAISNLQSEKEEQKAEIKALEEEKAKAEATVTKFKNMNFVGRFKYLFGFGKDE